MSNLRILHLTLHKKWFDTIASGEKKEEYRKIKPYWAKRFQKSYDAVRFVNGYGNHRPSILVELKEVSVGFGRRKWGAPTDSVYIIYLGKILETKNQ